MRSAASGVLRAAPPDKDGILNRFDRTRGGDPVRCVCGAGGRAPARAGSAEAGCGAEGRRGADMDAKGRVRGQAAVFVGIARPAPSHTSALVHRLLAPHCCDAPIHPETPPFHRDAVAWDVAVCELVAEAGYLVLLGLTAANMFCLRSGATTGRTKAAQRVRGYVFCAPGGCRTALATADGCIVATPCARASGRRRESEIFELQSRWRHRD